MTFDIEAMRRNRDAGTPGPWFVAGVRVKMDKQQWLAISRYDEANKRDENICCAGYDPRTGLGSVDARRIASIPSMEAEIERLTARVAELEGAISYIADGFCLDAPAFASPIFEDDDSLEDSEWIFEVIRAALSTPTEEPKT